jgi:hypothetical protein
MIQYLLSLDDDFANRLPLGDRETTGGSSARGVCATVVRPVDPHLPPGSAWRLVPQARLILCEAELWDLAHRLGQTGRAKGVLVTDVAADAAFVPVRRSADVGALRLLPILALFFFAAAGLGRIDHLDQSLDE